MELNVANSASSSSPPRGDLFPKLGFEKRVILFRDETVYGKWYMMLPEDICAPVDLATS
jgi:hypothetical protein